MVNHWRSSPENPIVPGGVCHMWLAWLDEEDPASFRNILSKDEALRAARYRDPQIAARFIVARGILRTLLGRYKRCDPEQLVFLYGPHGKPGLAEKEGDGISFNMSHSGGLAVLAIAKNREVGVDIEEFHPVSDMEATASIFLSPEEFSEFKEMSQAEKLERYFNLWTTKEAILKAQGTGFSTNDREMIKKFIDQGNIVCEQTRHIKTNQLTLFVPAEGFRGALACI